MGLSGEVVESVERVGETVAVATAEAGWHPFAHPELIRIAEGS